MHGSLWKRLQSKLSLWRHTFLIKQVFASWFYYDKLINHLYLNYKNTLFFHCKSSRKRKIVIIKVLSQTDIHDKKLYKKQQKFQRNSHFRCCHRIFYSHSFFCLLHNNHVKAFFYASVMMSAGKYFSFERTKLEILNILLLFRNIFFDVYLTQYHTQTFNN